MIDKYSPQRYWFSVSHALDISKAFRFAATYIKMLCHSIVVLMKPILVFLYTVFTSFSIVLTKILFATAKTNCATRPIESV